MASRHVLTAIMAVALAAVIVLPIVSVAAQEVPVGGWAERIVFFEEGDETKVLNMIKSGEMDIWLYRLRTADARSKAIEDPDIAVLTTYGGANDILLNPVPTETGFNPFTLREVREALNYIIDRYYIVNEIMKGYGVPRWTVFRAVSPDYTRVVEFMKVLEMKYRYDFEKGKEIIFKALKMAGATYKDGVWYYGGKPIELNFIIRIEDERKQIGDYIASQLEKLGFKVNRIYCDARTAFAKVYSGDPRSGEWHLYTEGWAYTAIGAYDDVDPEFFCVSEWSSPVFLYYKPPKELVELAKRLSNANYTSMEERLEMIKKITELALKDSVRIWLADTMDVFPYSAKIEAFVYDLYGGPFSLFTLRTLRLKETKTVDILRVGNRIMFISPWNPVGGLKWLYDTLVIRNVIDPGMWPHPHTGIYIPVRETWEVVTAGPAGKLDVPPDAIKPVVYLYNDTSIKTGDTITRVAVKWVPVGEGVKATSKVTFHFIFGKWHDGTEMTLADILYALAFSFELANSSSPIYDPGSVGPGLRAFVTSFKGIRIIDENTVEVYIDYWHIDPSYIAATADVWTTIPWTVYLLMKTAVEERQLAFSDVQKAQFNVEIIDLTKGPSLTVLKEYLDHFKSANYIPPELRADAFPENYTKYAVTSDEAAARWAGLADFYAKYGHFYVSNGPYLIEKVDTEAKQVVLKRFDQYLFKADKWDFLLVPKIPAVDFVEAPSTIVAGQDVTFKVKVTVAGKPYEEAEVKYLVFDAEGNLVTAGTAKAVGDGVYEITIPAATTLKMWLGSFTLMVVAVSREAAVPTTVTHTFTVLDLLSKLEQTTSTLNSKIADIDDRVSSLVTSVKTLESTTASLQQLVYAAIGIAVFSLLVALAAVFLAFRKK